MADNKVLSTVQSISGITFGTFLLPHLISHILSHAALFDAPAETHDFVLTSIVRQFFAQYYQNQIFEPIIITSALIHMISSMIKMSAEAAKKQESKDFKPAVTSSKNVGLWAGTAKLRKDLHGFSGVFLLFFFPGHYFAARLSPVLTFGSPSLAAEYIDEKFTSLSLKLYPGVFHVYYILLGSAGIYHTFMGIHYAINQLRTSNPPSKSSLIRGTSKIIARLTNERAMHKIGLIGVGLITSAVFVLGGAYFGIRFDKLDYQLEAFRGFTPKFLQALWPSVL